MTPFSFDTLGASKQLREAGMTEGMADAVVSVFQHTYETPGISHLATKDDLEAIRLEMKASFATKEELHSLEIRLMKQMQTQTWAMIGVLSGVIGLSTAVIKLFP